MNLRPLEADTNAVGPDFRQRRIITWRPANTVRRLVWFFVSLAKSKRTARPGHVEFGAQLNRKHGYISRLK
jgi:hypothetical protein